MKNKKINIGFFISDDGYGHAVRQSSIINNLLNHYKNDYLQIHIFGNKILKKIREKFKSKIVYHKLDNVIQTKKNLNGSLSLAKTKKNISYPLLDIQQH